MWKILIFNVTVGLLCACAYNYSEKGDFGLDWSFIEPEITQFENSIADMCDM
ncbi:hypothetical protein KNV07_gp069 [Vibrio phage Cody]|uniref:Membrane lipoprotein n=4 Tax=Thalassavirus TaxID=2948922 RepID=A0A6M9Z0K7_9CAUD|nr:hypothetical protein KNU88_gp069 [Vibrio phage Chester]YP_010108112.1 hypothetical protein KNV06_gp067 [Vibrio phage AG74]YP_010108305.1 hypothetical protein KNV07_gp069 [Vibrio phage Cody]YP_010114240.1 hypothetical protein KNV71_gp070 [Vibrio phage Gary]QIG66191.1 hypothetical protein CILSICK_70 [Vibrio phage Cilsick]QKN84537.1 hypothetical protein BBMUFFIN_71 [Vibrio phage BBMuffin]QKN85511.1 hypothetical protein DIREPILLOW8_72 [Vibrio phage Direpillow8]QQO89705.1 hypothetical protein 